MSHRTGRPCGPALRDTPPRSCRWSSFGNIVHHPLIFGEQPVIVRPGGRSSRSGAGTHHLSQAAEHLLTSSSREVGTLGLDSSNRYPRVALGLSFVHQSPWPGRRNPASSPRNPTWSVRGKGPFGDAQHLLRLLALQATWPAGRLMQHMATTMSRARTGSSSTTFRSARFIPGLADLHAVIELVVQLEVPPFVCVSTSVRAVEPADRAVPDAVALEQLQELVGTGLDRIAVEVHRADDGKLLRYRGVMMEGPLSTAERTVAIPPPPGRCASVCGPPGRNLRRTVPQP